MAAFRALGCKGLARTDFFLTKKGWVITEVNTMPGFTPISMYPALFEASGIKYQDLVENSDSKMVFGEQELTEEAVN